MTAHGGEEKTLRILREDIPAERSLITGGPLIDEALALWFRWHDEAGELPDWSVFRPFDYPHLLTNVSVCKQINEQYLCILVGEGILSLRPVKARGRFIHDVLPAEIANDVTTRFTRALDDKSPNYYEKAMQANPLHDFLRHCCLNLPFRCTRDGHDRILTLFEFKTAGD